MSANETTTEREAVAEVQVAASPEDRWAKLRAPFPAEAHGKKPQPLKKNADKGKCDDCGGWHGLPAIHIDFVGHAHVTQRLLEVDPAYELAPTARDERGLPLMEPDGDGLGCWARLTVLGVTHEEYGQGGDRKATWSDALKRCAMRHGIAVQVWQKTTNSEETPLEVEPEDTFGVCPRCKQGEIVKRKKKDGEVFAKCSKSDYRDKSTCQWVDWSPDFDAYAQRGVTAAAPAAAQTAPAQQRSTPPSAAPSRVQLLADVMAMDSDTRMTILRSFGYRGSAVNAWIGQLDEDVAAKLAHAIAPGNEDAEPVGAAEGRLFSDGSPVPEEPF